MKNTKIKILFVCMGNICRSPAAEGVMKSLIKKEKMNGKIEIDSAGMIDYHVGEEADPRMKEHAIKRGYELTSIARQFDPESDFEKFDYIIAMDNDNYYRIRKHDKANTYEDKIFKMIEFCEEITDASEVPDPYYGGEDGFEQVLDILEDSTHGLLKKIK